VVDSWLTNKSFDLWVCYYGDNPNTELAKNADFFFTNKGGKMQNFNFAYQNWKTELMQYESILLADDDILIAPSDINKLFEIKELAGLSALQPSFSKLGKISHPITQSQLFSKMRYANFLEITFVLFDRKRLFEFMDVFDPVVNCWGVDWWYSYFIKSRYGEQSLAIVDEIMCINPNDEVKPGGSEIEKLTSLKNLATTWNAFRNENNILTEQNNYLVYKIVRGFNPEHFCQYMLMQLKFQSSRIVNRLKKLSRY